MERPHTLRRLKLFAGLAVAALVLLAGIAWVERTPLLAWYAVQRLIRAGDSARPLWVERVAELDQAALPQLIACLRRADGQLLAGARAGLLEIAQRWQPGDCRRASLAALLAERFTTLGDRGRQVALEILAYLLKTTQAGAPPGELYPAATRMLTAAGRTTDAGVHGRAMALVLRFAAAGADPELLDACRYLTRTCLGDQAVANRLQAIQLALQPEIGLLEAVVPLLSDPVAEVRREAMLALGPAPAVITTDDLLHWLHDPDALVRELCEKALRSRGLGDEHLKLGRLLTDSRPGVRLRVLKQLRQATDLDPGVWLRHLSHDAAPAVRAAAVRAVREQAVSSLNDRLEQMAQQDPCPSVRQLAQYYLTSQRSSSASSTER